MKKNSGITLMSLIVTIIILLILAGVSIRSLTGSKGLINQAKETKTAAEIQGIEEQIELAKVKAELKSNDVTMEIIIQQLINDGVISDEAQVNQDTGDITFEDFVLEEKLADYVITPEEKYYGNKNTVVTNSTYFTFTVDEEKGTATITGVKDEYAVKAYQDGEATQYTVVIKDGDTYIKDVVIPYEYVDESGKKYTVTAIGWKAFYGVTGTNYTNVDEKFTSFVLPNSITTIGGSAFFACTDLRSINIPENVTTIYGGTFRGCASLNSINIPKGVTTILENVFHSCTSLSSIKIPAGVTLIGGSAFSGCKNLKSISVPDSVTSIAPYVFNGCASLNNIEIPNSVTNIGSYAFNGCTSLSSVEMSENIVEIKEGAFNNCRSLTSIEIPASVTSMGANVFQGCRKLETINVSQENTVYSGENGMLYNKDKTTLIRCPEGKVGEVVIPSSVTSLEQKSFYYCSSLSKVTIPDSVTSIGNVAFGLCGGLSSINIPSNVTTMGVRVFESWNAKQTINCEILEADKPDTWDSTWDYYNSTKTRQAQLNWGVSM